jgi:hypothetical protein
MRCACAADDPCEATAKNFAYSSGKPPGGCHPAAAVLLVSAAIGKTLVGDEGREESTALAERSGAGAFRQAPWGAARGGKAQRPFERVAAPTGAGMTPGSPAVRGGSPVATLHQPLH